MTPTLMARPLSAALLVALSALFTAPAQALDSDASAPIEIAADQLTLDDRAGTAVYSGAVDMQQGSMKLTAERVEITRNDQGQVSRVTATGGNERAYIEQKPSPDKPVVKGWGETIVYHAGQRRVELIRRAELHQGGDTFNGAHVEYFLDRGRVQASSASQQGSDGRVRMTLTPQDKTQ